MMDLFFLLQDLTDAVYGVKGRFGDILPFSFIESYFGSLFFNDFFGFIKEGTATIFKFFLMRKEL